MKDFIILGHLNEITCKDIFPLAKEGKVWWGKSISSGGRKFTVPDDYPLEAVDCGMEGGQKYIVVTGVRWWTNVGKNSTPPLVLETTGKTYEWYDNYPAINCDRTSDIPRDYYGTIGVPVTFFDKWCERQFNIEGLLLFPKVNGKNKYKRLLIKRRMKDFIFLGNQMCVSYNGIRERFETREFRFGFSIHGGRTEFLVSDDYPLVGAAYREEGGKKYISTSNARWITNIPVDSSLPLEISNIEYTPDKYPAYDNYPAINVRRITKIPKDYKGLMGVPIGILDHIDDSKIEIVRIKLTPEGEYFKINGKETFIRIIIKLK